MRSDSADGHAASIEQGEETPGYEPPALVVLGTFAELTQQGGGPGPDEVFNDGSQI